MREYRRDGSARLAHKPLLDTLLHVAFAEAARRRCLSSSTAATATPTPTSGSGTRCTSAQCLEEPGYRGMPVVLLHECYPYTREGGYLAAVYGNVYLDLSYGIPLLGYGEMFSFTTRRSASP